MKNKKIEKKSILPIILCIIIIFIAIISLPSLNRVFWKSNNVEVTKEAQKKDKIPKKYQCSYGPAVDSFYNYIKHEYVIFNFDEKGNITSLDSEIKYQVTTINDYNQMLQVLILPDENVTYDTENFVVTIRSKENKIFPENYKDLKKYLSSNLYTCVEE